MTQPVRHIKPQEGPQEAFLSTNADIAIYGGAAGGGKTYALVLEPIRHLANPRFGGVIFRRTSTQIDNTGGLWDTSKQLYPYIGGRSVTSPNYEWRFPSNSRVQMRHLQYDKNVDDWQGSQIPYIGFDELTHFSEYQFWMLASRSRTTSGMRPYIRATCNPDPDSFVFKLIEWYIDPITGFPIPERSGVIRYFIRLVDDGSDEIIWASNPRVLKKRFPKLEPKSFTFIASSLEDNKILMEADPGYAATLESLPSVERKRLRYGNWLARPAAGSFFKKAYFKIVEPEAVPPLKRVCRGWDLAATDPSENKDADFTSSVKTAMGIDDYIYVFDHTHDQLSPYRVEQDMTNLASYDGEACIIGLAQDPGQAGKAQIHSLRKMLHGYTVRSRTMSGDKIIRAYPVSSAAEGGLIRLVRGPWNDKFIKHLEDFPPKSGSPDTTDAFVEAHYWVTRETEQEGAPPVGNSDNRVMNPDQPIRSNAPLDTPEKRRQAPVSAAQPSGPRWK